MFRAFSGLNQQSAQAGTSADAAARRLDGIGQVLAKLDMPALSTQQDINRALWTLDAAVKCIRAVLVEFREHPAADQIARKSRNLIERIEQARDEILTQRSVVLN
jgi:CTP:molybdopterin cytidylyltransferase MocA